MLAITFFLCVGLNLLFMTALAAWRRPRHPDPGPLDSYPRVTVQLPPPAELPDWQYVGESEGHARTSATDTEPGSPPFEQLVVEAKPQDDSGLRDFCVNSFPPSARELKEQGTVVLLIRIEPDGHISDMKLEESSGSIRLDRVTQACVVSALFEPHRAGLRAVGSWQRIHWTWSPTS